jgi:hypothetical protein
MRLKLPAFKSVVRDNPCGCPRKPRRASLVYERLSIRTNPTAGLREDLIEAVPESLAADLRVVFNEMLPRYNAINRLVLTNYGVRTDDEDVLRNYWGQYTELVRLAYFASGLVEAAVTDSMSRDEALALAYREGSRASGTAWDKVRYASTMQPKKLRSYASQWAERLQRQTSPQPSEGRIYETMLVMLDDATNPNGIYRVWTLPLRNGWETFVRDDVTLTVKHDAFVAGEDVRTEEEWQMSEDDRTFERGEALWRESTDWAVDAFAKRHGRRPFPYENLIEALSEAFASGFDGQAVY